MSQPLIQNWNDPSEWSTTAAPEKEQFDRWVRFVNEAYLTWSIARTAPRGGYHFPAFIREGRYDNCRLATMTSPQEGTKGCRGRKELASDTDKLYGLLYVVKGSQIIDIDNKMNDVKVDSFLLWDSAKPMTFTTSRNLKQITFCIPHRKLQARLPNVTRVVGELIPARAGVSRLLANHLVSLEANFGDLTSEDASIVVGSTIDLIATMLDTTLVGGESKRNTGHLREIKALIEKELDDPNLNPAAIASKAGMTVRHLHRLFGHEGTTVMHWIQRRRLEHCRRDLMAASRGTRTVTDIAYRWGITDSSSFSRLFKKEFGLCPSKCVPESGGEQESGAKR